MAGARMAGDITLEKEIPYNLDAERAVLGAIMVVNSAMNAAQEFLKDTDFYRDQHRRVYKAMSVLSERASAIDPITVVDELRRTGELEVVGGHAWVVSLIDGVPHSANIEHYAKIVKQQSIRRALIEAGGKIVETAYDGSDTVEDLLDQSERLVFQIAQDQLRGGFVPMSILAEEGLRTIERLQTQRSNITGLATGYGELDEKTSGFQPGDLIIVAARPSMGKTAFAMNIAQNCANMGRRVGVFSLEMSRDQLFLRLLTGQARIDAHAMRTGRLTREQWRRVTETIAEMSQVPIAIDDTAGVGIMEMRAKSRRLMQEQGLDLVIIDYLQLMRGRGRHENRNQEITEISRSLKELAKELRVPVIAISQLSRAPEQRGPGSKPQLSDLRESGAIEQDADVVLFIFREEVYKPTEENRGLAQVIIAKQRNGPIGTLEFAFLREYTRFEQREWRPE
jgi:replicative DNA helicase